MAESVDASDLKSADLKVVGVQVSLLASLKTLMKKFLAALGAFTLLPAIVFANEEKLKDGFYSFDAMGCMLLRECTEGIEPVVSLLDVSHNYEDWEKFTPYATEFNAMVGSLSRVGVKVFLADEKYFPVGHRGVYHTVSNNFFLNKTYMRRPSVLMSVMRHEGWHAAQDCMAGTIDNSMIAIILPEEKVPMLWQEIAEDTYKHMPNAIPWEKEATWAGKTEGMTMRALEACARGNMWEVYPPTPMTKEWLIEKGYIKE